MIPFGKQQEISRDLSIVKSRGAVRELPGDCLLMAA
jgi:hypothetical protein